MNTGKFLLTKYSYINHQEIEGIWRMLDITLNTYQAEEPDAFCKRTVTCEKNVFFTTMEK